MGVTKLIIFLFLVGGCLIVYTNAQHISRHMDFMGWQDKEHIIFMTRELLTTMQLQERQLLPLKEEHVSRMAYQVGLVMGIMREKYKRMMEIYGELWRRRFNYTKITGPGVWINKPIHYMIGLETVRMLQVEIDKYVDLLLMIPEKELTEDANQFSAKMNISMGPPGGFPPGSMPPGGIPSGGMPGFSMPPGGIPGFSMPPGGIPKGMLGGRLRMRAVTDKDSTPSALVNNADENGPPMLSEQDIKRQYRESYMKQNGIKGSEWSLDHYYGFN